jgi:hypothetical protein
MDYCHMIPLGKQFNVDAGQATGFVEFGFQSLKTCNAFSGCKLATHSIDCPGHVILHTSKYNFN